MSDRGSFVTEYIYCHECSKKIIQILTSRGVRFETVGETSSIIAGFLGSTYSGGELIEFQYGEERLFDKDNAPCHPVRFAVLAEQGQRIFIVGKDGSIKDINN